MAGKLMHAFVYDSHGKGVVGLKHVQVPVPSPGKDEVLIKLEATSLNPVDWKAYPLKALVRPVLARNSPLIPATDVAGEVVETGSGVKNFKPGDKVVAMLSLLKGGGLSEYGVAKENFTASRPAEVSPANASGLLVAGITALKAVTQFAGIRLNKTEPQKNVLITGGSGGLGQYAVQLAKLGNNHVTTTCGARNVDLLKSLGADEVLDYNTPEGAALKSPSGRKYDAVIHSAPAAISWSVFEGNLSDKGIVVDLTPGPSSIWTSAVKKITCSGKKLVPFMTFIYKEDGLDYLIDLLKEGKIKTVIDSKYGLMEAEEAWKKGIAGHATGKIIVEHY